MELIKRIEKDSWPGSEYSIICSKRELDLIYERGIDVLKDQIKRTNNGYLAIDDDPDKEYTIVLSKDELETLQSGLCCDSARDLRSMIRKMEFGFS
jgi:hypothetical protein